MILADGFTLALGGGGARGWAHIGVARGLDRLGMRPTRIVGTSMGAIIGAGMAAGRTPEQMEEAARRTNVYRLMRRGRLALFDARPLLERTAAELGDPRIEDLPIPLGITTYDLVAGRPRLITSGSLVDALERSIAVPFFLPPQRDADGVWCDAGPWEGVPVTLSRAWDPSLPVVGVLADIPKPAFLASRIGASLLRGASVRLAGTSTSERLTARRFLSLVTARWADPVVVEPPDVLIAPRLGRMNALHFGRIGPAIAIGERDTVAALGGIDTGPRREMVTHGV
ncbi:MAG TPA: patatin-like phospholipase family protein [Patescibacteria group bacterium]|nr:patatin-like phospholipase family protein [Patescibacteria group bacterium]